jgi:cell division protein FtsZ
MSINIDVSESVVIKPTITVFGIGGAGCNAVNNMISTNLQGANFVVANTDSQSLHHSLADHKIQLGEGTTQGLGAGASPEIGENAAKESEEDIREQLRESNMVFITAGMGGGTGTGAAPEIARLAREEGILTVGVVTKPFHFEGAHRMRIAEKGLEKLHSHVDTLIVIPNQNLFRLANERTTFADAFKMADDVLHAGVRGVTDLMIMPGLINLDFADIRTVMLEMGKAMMGTGEASGEERAVKAAESAISNPLLDNSSMKGAKGVLINITGGNDMTLFEVDAAANRIRNEVSDNNANIIFGSTFNPDLEGSIRVSVVATGIDQEEFATSPQSTSQQEGLESTSEQNISYKASIDETDMSATSERESSTYSREDIDSEQFYSSAGSYKEDVNRDTDSPKNMADPEEPGKKILESFSEYNISEETAGDGRYLRDSEEREPDFSKEEFGYKTEARSKENDVESYTSQKPKKKSRSLIGRIFDAIWDDDSIEEEKELDSGEKAAYRSYSQSRSPEYDRSEHEDLEVPAYIRKKRGEPTS